jgi:hypothetical protein
MSLFLEEEMYRAIDGDVSELNLIEQLQAVQKETGILKPTVEALKSTGLALWQTTLGDTRFMETVPKQQQGRLIELVGRELIGQVVARALEKNGDQFATELATALAEALPVATVMQMVFSAYWVDAACPVIQIPHTYAAALMATDPPAELDEVRPPWPAFIVQVPSGMLTIRDEVENRRVEVRNITVAYQFCEARQRMEWYVTTLTETSVSIFRTGVSTQELIDADLKLLGSTADDAFCFDLDTEDKRTEMLLYRLVVNVCVAMENPDNFKAPKNEHSSKPRREQKVPPDNRIFKLGKPLELDLRPKLKEYLSHGSKRREGAPPSVQFLVRGHWKMQVHGKGRLERKRIWITPFWKGPDGTPVLSRPHRVEG